MATLINGNGNPAVYANQDADLIASICGDTTCISAVGSQFAATQEDANTIGLADGVIITKEGRRIQLDVGYTDLFTIPTGTAGTTSYYIIGYKLTTGSDSKQTCETFVQKMNSSSETITEDTFRGGASDVYVSVYRVVQDGLNIDSITGLLPTLSLGAQTSSSHSGSGSTVTTTLAANKTLDEVAQQMLNNDYALKSALDNAQKITNNLINTDITTATSVDIGLNIDSYRFLLTSVLGAGGLYQTAIIPTALLDTTNLWQCYADANATRLVTIQRGANNHTVKVDAVAQCTLKGIYLMN